MRSLTWLTSCQSSGSNSARYLVAGYALDTPPAEISMAVVQDIAPDLFDLFNAGRMVPLGENRPYVVRTQFLPGDDVLRPYAAATAKVVYLVRDPRDLVSNAARTSRIRDGQPPAGEELVARLDAASSVRGTRRSWEEHVREWIAPDRVRTHFPALEDLCVLRYEDLQTDPAEVLRTIVGFLGTLGPVDEDRIRRAVRDWTQEAVRSALLAADPIKRFQERRRGQPKQTTPPPAELGPEVDAAYRLRLRRNPEFATLVARFGYEVAAR